MAWKPIQNITLLANEGDTIILPTQVPSVDIDEDGTIHNTVLVNIDFWENSNKNKVRNADTSKSGEFMYYGTVVGYPYTVYCSVVVGDSEEQPLSQFPINFKDVKDDDKPDEFGIPKEEVRTSDMPHITDYQYFKAKKNRTTFESVQLQKLTELMASKIIMAKDINHLRSSIKNTQEFCLSLKKGLDETVTDGENIGNGDGEIFSGLVDNNNNFGKKMQFRTIKAGENINVSTNGDEIEISAEGSETEITNDMCNLDPIKAKSVSTCGIIHKGDKLERNNGAFFRFGQGLGIKVARANQTEPTMMFVFGRGDGVENSMVNAGRMYKGIRDFIIEMKFAEGNYAGIRFKGNYGKNSSDKTGGGIVEIYGTEIKHSTDTSYSRIASAMVNKNADEIWWNDNEAFGIASLCGDE